MPGNNYQGPPGNLPQFIKCSGCHKNKESKTGYSNVALGKFKTFAHKQRLAEKSRKDTDVKKDETLFIICKQCTVGPRQALTCRVCYETKGVDWFAKTQRRNPDNARCIECTRATDLVLPISADDLVGDGILEDIEDGNDNNDDVVSVISSRKNEEYFIKERSGQYYSSYVDDASTISNPWNSRAGSEVDLRGSFSRRTVIEIPKKKDTLASSTTSSTRSTANRLTSENVATLGRKLNKVDLDANSWKTSPSLARYLGESQSIPSDSDSDGSVATIRTKADNSNKSSTGGVPVSKAKSVGKQTVQANQTKKSHYRSPYSDSSSDDDDDDYSSIKFPTVNEIGINIYGKDDWGSENKNVRGPSTDSNLVKPRAGNGKRPAILASQSMQSQDISVSFRTASTDLDSEDVKDTPVDFRSVARGTRMAASGFRNNQYGKQNKNFPRVRPNNMLASDFEKSLLFRKNDADTNRTKRAKLPEEVDSDDEW